MEKIYPKGIIVFGKLDKAPDFVKGTLIITPADLVQWLHDNQQLCTDYQGKMQIKLQILEGNKGLYLVVDNYKKEDSSLPF